MSFLSSARCRLCWEQDHASHIAQYFTEDIKEKIRRDIELKKSRLDENLKETRSIVSQIEQEMRRRATNVDTVRQDVRQRVQELRTKLDEYETQMLQELEKRADISSLHERYEIQSVNSFQITRLLKFLDVMKDKGSDRDLVQFRVKLCEMTDHVLSATINNQFCLDDLRADITF